MKYIGNKNHHIGAMLLIYKMLLWRVTLLLAVFGNFSLQAKNKIEHRHSLTPMIGLASNSTSAFSISPDPSLRIDYLNGDHTRIPINLRYQYRMRQGNRLGFDVLGNYNPIYVKPSFYSKDFGYVGPSVLNQKGSMIGAI